MIGYCSELKKKRKEKLDRLQTELKESEDKLTNTMNQRIQMEIDRKKNKSNDIYSDNINRKLIFLRQHYEAGG